MITKTKIALIAAVAAIGIATPALADGVPVIPQYSLPSEVPTLVVDQSQQSHRAVAHSRALYDSATAPSNDSASYGDTNYNNWANDAEWSTTGRQNAGH
jgi:hypothetical protein